MGMFQYSDVIVDDSLNHGIDGNFTYVVKHLEPSTHYHMKVASTNSESDPQLSESTADFWTKGMCSLKLAHLVFLKYRIALQFSVLLWI